jgi:hypothetical protein
VFVIELVARETFTFEGVTHVKGESFSVRPIVAAALTYQRKAMFASQYQSRDLSAEAESRPRRRRTYRRRDMVAESA